MVTKAAGGLKNSPTNLTGTQEVKILKKCPCYLLEEGK